jgi:hypothetical protein
MIQRIPDALRHRYRSLASLLLKRPQQIIVRSESNYRPHALAPFWKTTLLFYGLMTCLTIGSEYMSVAG